MNVGVNIDRLCIICQLGDTDLNYPNEKKRLTKRGIFLVYLLLFRIQIFNFSVSSFEEGIFSNIYCLAIISLVKVLRLNFRKI